MAGITAALVKELREKTGAGMMDCKKALTETGGVVDDAVDWLRKNGLAAAAKKAGRIAAEGLVAVAISGTKGAVVEVNAETDFVARNAEFQDFVSKVGVAALETDGDVDALVEAKISGGGKVGEVLTDLVAKIGENMSLRRVARLEVASGVVASYVHAATAPGMGRIGVLVALESAAPADKLKTLGHQLAMHVAAASPQWVDTADVDTTALDRERHVLAEQARASGKPENIVEKMVEGRLRKYYEEVVLLEQIFVVDGETRVRAAIETAGKAAGADITVAGIARFGLGEGIERKAEDFAAEVAATLGG